nr:hypothetical protein [Actinomycetota bacterium]
SALVPQPAPGCDAHGRRLRRPALSLRHLRDGLAVRPSSLVLVLFGSGGSPIVSLIILGLSGALILVDFSYLR